MKNVLILMYSYTQRLETLLIQLLFPQIAVLADAGLHFLLKSITSLSQTKKMLSILAFVKNVRLTKYCLIDTNHKMVMVLLNYFLKTIISVSSLHDID